MKRRLHLDYFVWFKEICWRLGFRKFIVTENIVLGKSARCNNLNAVNQQFYVFKLKLLKIHKVMGWGWDKTKASGPLTTIFGVRYWTFLLLIVVKRGCQTLMSQSRFNLLTTNYLQSHQKPNLSTYTNWKSSDFMLKQSFLFLTIVIFKFFKIVYLSQNNLE